MSTYLPDVAWSTLASNVSTGTSTYRYYVDVLYLDPNEPGAAPRVMIVGDWFIDYAGYPFIIEGIVGSTIEVYDINERGDGISSAYGPYANRVGFVYRPKNGAFLLTQAQLRKLDASATDIINPIEKGVLWSHLMHIDQTSPQTITGGRPIFKEGIVVDPDPATVPHQKGAIHYDKDWDTLAVDINNDITLQLAQETQMYVYNNSGVNINDGQPVYATGIGSTGGKVVTTTVALAKADKSDTSNVLGCATTYIADGSYGHITLRGNINGFDTTAFGVAGNDLYLSPITAGLLTTTKPTAPNIIVRVGKLNVSNVATGSITVSTISWGDVLTLSELKATQNPGICAETPLSYNDISIDCTSRILTITPPLGYFHFFTDGGGTVIKYEKIGSVAFPAFTNTSGTWYFYFNSSGSPISTQVPWSDFAVVAPVWRLTWDSTKTPDTAKLISSFMEYHVNDISAIDHAWKHKNGAIWYNGLDVFSNYLASPGSPNADGRNTVIGLSGGQCLDDNLPYTIANTATPTTIWQQDLGSNTPASLNATNSGQFKIRYKGPAGSSELEAATRFPFLWHAAADVNQNRPEYVNSSGVKTLVSQNYFFVSYVYSVQDGRVGNTIRVTPVYQEFATITEARATTWETIQVQDNLALDTEIRPLYRLIFEYKSTYGAGCKYSVLREVTDIRKSIITQTTTSAGSIAASSVTSIPTLPFTGTNLQTNLEEAAILFNTRYMLPFTYFV